MPHNAQHKLQTTDNSALRTYQQQQNINYILPSTQTVGERLIDLT